MTIARSSRRRGRNRPGVSTKTSWLAPSIAMPRIRVARRLHLVGDDRDLRPDHPVQERRLAGVRLADQRDEAAAGIQGPTSPLTRAAVDARSPPRLSSRQNNDNRGRRAGMATVTIRDLRKSFGAVEILHGVSIDIDGRRVRRPRRPLGLRQVDAAAHDRRPRGRHLAARSRSAARVVNDLPPKERDIAMVFQNYALYPHMTVAENMAFSLTLKSAPKAEIEARVGRAAEILGLDRAARPLPAPALRRPAPARRHGPRHRARPAGLPVRRAAVQPRRQAARRDARRDQGTCTSG